MRPKLFTALLATALTIGIAAPAGAMPMTADDTTAPAETAPHSTWSVVPATEEGPDGRGELSYIVEPGFTYHDHIAVRNHAETPLTVTLAVRDAEQTPENDFVLTDDEQAQGTPSSWFSIDSTEVTVEPRSSLVVPITLTVPADAEPGDHSGGVVAVLDAPANDAEGTDAGTEVRYAVGTRAHVRVAGPVEPKLSVDSFEGRYRSPVSPIGLAPLLTTATVVNTGNIRVSGTARVEAVGLFGLWSAKGDAVPTAELLRGGATTLSSGLAEVPQIGPVWVTFTVDSLKSGDQDLDAVNTKAETITVVVWAVPWSLIIVIVLFAIAIGIAVRNLRLRLRSRAQSDALPDGLPEQASRAAD